MEQVKYTLIAGELYVNQGIADMHAISTEYRAAQVAITALLESLTVVTAGTLAANVEAAAAMACGNPQEDGFLRGFSVLTGLRSSGNPHAQQAAVVTGLQELQKI